VALVDAVNWAEKHRHIKSASRVLKDYVSAVSVGVINGTPMLDLPYIEDSQAMTDMNVAMTGSGTFIEIQGTAEHRPFNRAELGTLLDLAEKGNKELQAAQRAALSLD
jgi:ribonuclease PH